MAECVPPERCRACQEGIPAEIAPCLCKSAPTVREAGDEGIAAVLTDATCACGHPVWGGWHKRKIGCEADDCPCLLDAPTALAPLIAEREAKVWREGYRAGWDDRHKDEDSPLPAGEQHDTPNPYDRGEEK